MVLEDFKKLSRFFSLCCKLILLSFLHPMITWAKFGWNWLRGSGGDDSLIKVNVIFLKSFYFSHWRRLFPFISGNLNNHNPKMLCIIISLISFLKKKLWPFIWLLQSLFQRMLCVKFGWILVIGSEKKFVIFFKKLLILFHNDITCIIRVWPSQRYFCDVQVLLNSGGARRDILKHP